MTMMNSTPNICIIIDLMENTITGGERIDHVFIPLSEFIVYHKGNLDQL